MELACTQEKPMGGVDGKDHWEAMANGWKLLMIYVITRDSWGWSQDLYTLLIFELRFPVLIKCVKSNFQRTQENHNE